MTSFPKNTASRQTFAHILKRVPGDIKKLEPSIVVTMPGFVQQLEACSTEWISELKLVVQLVDSAKVIPDQAKVLELPLEEVYFWRYRVQSLQPLAEQVSDSSGEVQWMIKVLSLATSDFAEALTKAIRQLQTRFSEASWNYKYLRILEKPFTVLASGRLYSVSTCVRSMGRTIKMIARSSKFYNTRMKIESLIDRVTLALCIIVATQCNPSNLLCHGSYDRYFGGRVRFTHTVSEARKAIEHPTHILTSGIDVLSHWCDVLEEKSQGALSSGIDSMCPLWKTLNLTLLLHYPKYICCRCEELLRYFDRLEHLIREGDVNGNIFETICTSL